MISNQILQTNIEGMKSITRVELCICDTEGKVLASTFTGAEEYENAISTHPRFFLRGGEKSGGFQILSRIAPYLCRVNLNMNLKKIEL